MDDDEGGGDGGRAESVGPAESRGAGAGGRAGLATGGEANIMRPCIFSIENH